MKARGWAAVAGMIALSIGSLQAQERDAQVLRPGQIRLSAGADYLHVVETFGDGDGAEPDRIRLIPERYSPLVPLAAGLTGFFAGTGEGGVPFDSAMLSAGELSLGVAWTTRTLPLRVNVGLLPRVQVGASLGIAHYERLVGDIGYTPGNLGVNPDPSGNAARIGAVDPSRRALGSSALLPVAGSPLGQRLQSHVVTRTGQSLALPENPATFAQLETVLGIAAPDRLASLWRPAFVDLDGRIELLRSFSGGLYPPEGNSVAYRVSVGGGVRIPVTFGEEEDFRTGWGPEPILPGDRGEAVVDLFFGDRLWLSGGGELAIFRPRESRLATDPRGTVLLEGNDIFVRRSAGNEMELWAMPRLRLTREISVGGLVRSRRWDAGTDEIGGVAVPIPADSRQSVGFSFRYTTLPARAAGMAVRPIEAMVGFTAPVREAAGARGGSVAFLQVALHQRLWGAANRAP